MEAQEFLDWITPTAQAVCNKYDLPSACVIAQGAIESGWNTATIGQFNLFGRKAVDGDKSITVPTQEYVGNGIYQTIYAAFKDYDSLDEAIDDWCQLMEWGPYQPYANQYHQDHILECFVRGIASIYATSPTYAQDILETISANNLT